MAKVNVTYTATPDAGVAASQPMFINRAWVTVSDTLVVPTGNNTYHQGAGVGIMTFSAGFGGSIYNAVSQALDYRTTARSGVLVVSDEGYKFAGWNHPEYISLRGNRIPANDGIMHYDTLTVYGSVDMHANFALEEYPIVYYLHGSTVDGNVDITRGHDPLLEVNANDLTRGHDPLLDSTSNDLKGGLNPLLYTIKSPSITLTAPSKPGDEFIGWTGSNGDIPQLEVTIPHGSTGERTYFANFLRSGRELSQTPDFGETDKIRSVGDELHIFIAKSGSIVRIYTPDGVLHRIQTIVAAGETKIKLERGIYIVTLNNSPGTKIIIN